MGERGGAMSEHQTKRGLLAEIVDALREVETKADHYDGEAHGVDLALDAVKEIAVQHGVAMWSTLVGDEVVFIDEDGKP